MQFDSGSVAMVLSLTTTCSGHDCCMPENTSQALLLGLFDGAKNVLFTKGDNKLYMYRRDNPLYYVKTEDYEFER